VLFSLIYFVEESNFSFITLFILMLWSRVTSKIERVREGKKIYVLTFILHEGRNCEGKMGKEKGGGNWCKEVSTVHVYRSFHTMRKNKKK